MKIYHYTSIQTLALILHYKTMRFNRLDRVDDIEEAVYGSGPRNINMSQFHSRNDNFTSLLKSPMKFGEDYFACRHI